MGLLEIDEFFRYQIEGFIPGHFLEIIAGGTFLFDQGLQHPVAGVNDFRRRLELRTLTLQPFFAG